MKILSSALSACLAWGLVSCATSNPSRPTAPAPLPEPELAQPAAPESVAPTVERVSESQPPETTQGQASEASSANADEEAPNTSVAVVAGMKIDVAELLAQWLFHDSPEVHETLGELILSRFAIAEATRLEMRISPQDMEKAYALATEALAREVERARPGETVDDFIERYRGLDPKTYRERLREQSARALLAERVVRAWLLETDHVWARAIVVDDKATLDEVEKELAAGRSFEELAKEKSSDPSAERGGLLPPIVRSADSVVSRLAFATPVGERGGPIEDSGRYMLIEIVERPAPVRGNWIQIGGAVEASLDARPVDPIEWLQWERAMYDRYEVDTRPFLRMVGEPAR